MKKMMYIMNVPWSWIKQRPHFLAENLVKHFDVDVYFKKAFAKSRMVKNKSESIKSFELFRLPFERFYLVNKMSTLLIVYQIKKNIKKYEYIWISDPKLFLKLGRYVSKNQKVIYDCMDDLLEFPSIKNCEKQTEFCKEAEKILIESADVVFVSSDFLKEKLINRYDIKDNLKMLTVNNGIKESLLENKKAEKIELSKSNNKKITYIGTISEWFDFELILSSLEKYSDIEYHLFGPKEVEIPVHNRIIDGGILEHDKILSVMKSSDMLIMPFKINELILSVNPVKLYEYISSGIPTCSVKYGETLKFEKFIYLYRDEKDYMKIIDSLRKNKLNKTVNKENVESFLTNSTWDKREENIYKFLIGEFK